MKMLLAHRSSCAIPASDLPVLRHYSPRLTHPRIDGKAG